MPVTEIATAVGCAAIATDAVVDHVATDSRKVRYGSLFAALPGSQVDGHDFAETAVSLGATALLVQRRLELEVPQLVVDDVLRALGRLASHLRNRLDPRVIGITGSNGKTTVKEMVAGVLSQSGEVLATRGNYNNELGLPLSLFGLEPEHRYAVLEMGASQAGDIAYLAEIARPDIGLITNIGPAHLRGFGSIEGVARAKGEIYAGLAPGGCAIMNGDESWTDTWMEMNRAERVLQFGTGADCDIRLDDSGGTPMIRTAGGDFELRIGLPGRHNMLNAAAATAVGVALDLPLETIQKGLETVQAVPGRLNLIRTGAGWTVIDDTYNANPASLYSALQVLSEMQGTPWLVLGDMKELGQDSSKMHREVGENARALGIKRLFATGDMSAHTVDAFGEGASHYEDRDELVAALCEELRAGIICLVKGSRSMEMEAVVEAIAETAKMREAS
jgi:UDP-N-acetylmuramoyl-tripeptide--D-alanyl-D-alanine ligase